MVMFGRRLLLWEKNRTCSLVGGNVKKGKL